MISSQRKVDINKYLDGNAEAAQSFRAEQINAILRLAPIMMLFHSIVAIFLIWFFRNDAPPLMLGGWAAAFFAVVLNNLDYWRRNKRGEIDHSSDTAIRLMIVKATALSLIWGIAAVFLFPISDLKHQIALAFIMLSMISIGAFSLVTVRQAAICYVMVFTICSICALMMTGDKFFVALSGLQGTWALALTVAVLHHSFLFAERMMMRSVMNNQTVILEQLTNDLEGTLDIAAFELDHKGVVTAINRGLARKLGLSQAEILGMQFSDLLRVDITLSKHPNYLTPDTLDTLIEQGEDFRSKVVSSAAGGKTRYWRLSGRPINLSKTRGTGWRILVQNIDQEVAILKNSAVVDEINLVSGLANRKAFEKKIHKLLTRNLKQHVKFACIVIGIDNLEEVLAETSGAHRDNLLKAVGMRMKTHMAGQAIIAHFENDQFGVLCPLKQPPQTTLKTLAAILGNVFDVDGHHILLDFRMGCYVGPEAKTRVSDVIEEADKALALVRYDDVPNWMVLEANKAAQNEQIAS